MNDKHAQLWRNLRSLMDCDGQGGFDQVFNMLIAKTMLFMLSDEDMALLENPEAIVTAKKKHQHMLGHYLTVNYGRQVASEKLAILGNYVKLAEEFYTIHQLRLNVD